MNDNATNAGLILQEGGKGTGAVGSDLPDVVASLSLCIRVEDDNRTLSTQFTHAKLVEFEDLPPPKKENQASEDISTLYMQSVGEAKEVDLSTLESPVGDALDFHDDISTLSCEDSVAGVVRPAPKTRFREREKLEEIAKIVSKGNYGLAYAIISFRVHGGIGWKELNSQFYALWDQAQENQLKSLRRYLLGSFPNLLTRDTLDFHRKECRERGHPGLRNMCFEFAKNIHATTKRKPRDAIQLASLQTIKRRYSQKNRTQLASLQAIKQGRRNKD